MRFLVVTGCLASLMATLVVVTTSLPQLGKTRHPHHFFNHQPPKGCLVISSQNYRLDVELKLLKRDSQSPKTHAVALSSRVPPLACGETVGAGQSTTFQLPANVDQALEL